jgi:hypothetical protein
MAGLASLLGVLLVFRYMEQLGILGNACFFSTGTPWGILAFFLDLLYNRVGTPSKPTAIPSLGDLNDNKRAQAHEAQGLDRRNRRHDYPGRHRSLRWI